MENSCHFGWFFKESNITGSLLGLQTGTVLLRAPQGVKKIRLTGRIISKWENKDIFTRSQSFTLDVPPSGESALDLGAIQDLTDFPLTIELAKVAAILHTSCEKLLPVGMASPGCSAIGSGPSATSDPKNPLIFTPNYDFVTKSSLQSYLGLSTAQAPPPAKTQ
jgi:hypothetical protein